MILKEGVGIGCAGIVVGAACAFALVRTLAGLLYGVGPADAPWFVAAAGSLLVISAVASYGDQPGPDPS